MSKREVICGIYKITSPSGRIYIGQSIDIYTAWNVRYKILGKCIKQRRIYNSIKKYGRDAHKLEIIHRCDKCELNHLEEYYVDLYDSTNNNTGLNCRKGGGARGTHSEESILIMKQNHWSKRGNADLIKKKISIVQSGRPSPRKGTNLPKEHVQKIIISNKGKKRSIAVIEEISIRSKKSWEVRKQNGTHLMLDEQKKKISESNTIAYSDPKRREVLRNRRLGKKASEETLKRQSDSRKKLYESGFVNPKKGTKSSPETIEKLRISHTGLKQSPETIAKRIAKTRGQKRTPEQIARRVESRLRNKLERLKNESKT